ncbi:uncharacterized protein V6R79_021239 [Siganus canaliculatus]
MDYGDGGGGVFAAASSSRVTCFLLFIGALTAASRLCSSLSQVFTGRPRKRGNEESSLNGRGRNRCCHKHDRIHEEVLGSEAAAAEDGERKQLVEHLTVTPEKSQQRSDVSKETLLRHLSIQTKSSKSSTVNIPMRLIAATTRDRNASGGSFAVDCCRLLSSRGVSSEHADLGVAAFLTKQSDQTPNTLFMSSPPPPPIIRRPPPHTQLQNLKHLHGPPSAPPPFDASLSRPQPLTVEAPAPACEQVTAAAAAAAATATASSITAICMTARRWH